MNFFPEIIAHHGQLLGRNLSGFLLTLLNGVESNEWSLPHDNPASVLYTSDGTKLALLDFFNATLYEYLLDITGSTPSIVQSGNTYTLGMLDPLYMKMRYDGGAIFAILGGSGYGYYAAKFILRIRNDFSTIKFDSLINLSSDSDSNPRAWGISNNGLLAWVLDDYNDAVINIYSLPTPHSVYGATLLDTINIYDLGFYESYTDITFDLDEKYAFISRSGGDYIQLKLNTPGDISSGVTVDGIATRDVVYGLSNDQLTFIKNDTIACVNSWIDKSLSIYDTNLPEVILPNIDDSSTKSFWPVELEVVDITSSASSPNGIAVNPDNTLMWILNTNFSNNMIEYSLPEMTQTGNTLNNILDGSVGEKILVVGDQLYVKTIEDCIYQYQLTSPWTLLGATLTHQLDVSNVSQWVMSFVFNHTQTKLYLLVADTDTRLIEYSLSIAGDISTAVRTATPPLILTDIPEDSGGDIVLSSDGNSVFILNWYESIIYKYSITSPGDLTQLEYAYESWHSLNKYISVDNIVFTQNEEEMYALYMAGGSVIRYTTT